MASFSIIFAWRFFILPKYERSAYWNGRSIYTGSSPHPGAAGRVLGTCPDLLSPPVLSDSDKAAPTSSSEDNHAP